MSESLGSVAARVRRLVSDQRPRGSGPRQVLMHPGPVNRGVELSGEVVDSPQAVITAQVEAGVVVRMAVLYELLAGARRPATRDARAAPGPVRHARQIAGEREPGRVRPPTARPRTAAVQANAAAARRARARPRRRYRRSPRRAHPGRRDRRARARPARSTGQGEETIDGEGRLCCAGVLRPPCAPAHPRPGAQGGPRLRDPRRRRRWLRRSDRDAEHRPRARLGAACCARCATRQHAKRGFPSASCRAITRGLQGEQLTEMAELRQEGALGFTDDGRPVGARGCSARRCSTQRLCGGVIALHEEDARSRRGGAMHEGASARARHRRDPHR